MAMIEPILHFTVPEQPSPAQLAVIERARALHPDWTVRVWRDPVDPSGLPLSELWPRANSGAQRADLIRLSVVQREGGFYLDADVEMHRSLEPLRRYGFIVSSEDGQSLTNAVFGCERGHPALEALIERLAQGEIDWALPPHLTTGPALFTEVLQWRADVTVLPRATFYPYNWNQRRAGAEHWSYGTHLWARSWDHTIQLDPVERARRTLRRVSAGIGRRIKPHARRLVSRLAATASTPYRAEGVICAKTVHGFRILLDGSDLSVTPAIAHTGQYEPLEERFVATIMRGGDWAIDAGANVGLFTLLLAQKVGRFGRVFAYEPNPRCADLIASSGVMNWTHDRIVLRRAALGDTCGEATLRFVPGMLGGASLDDGRGQSAAAAVERAMGGSVETRVPVVTLDAEFPVDLPIRFMKVDVEGFEHALLAGARRLFDSHCVDVLMIEAVREIAGDSWPRLVAALRRITDAGYVPHRIGRNLRLRPVPIERMFDAGQGRNLFLVSPRARGLPRA
jgi:FkbM family methyltransferase